jgi:hypothetical protein
MDIHGYKSDKFFSYQKFINEKFKIYFSDLGYVMCPSVPVSTPIDSSVRFVGAITNVFKEYFLKGFIEKKGYIINQGCLKTRMLQNEIVKRSSYYPCQGILTNYSELSSVSIKFLSYIIETFNLSIKNIDIHVNSKDSEFAQVFNNLGFNDALVFDELNPDKYIHDFGVENVSGRNIAIFTKPSNNQKRIFIGTIIIVEKESKPIFIEATLKPISIIIYTNQFKHELDCYPDFNIQSLTINEYYKFKDSLIVATLLFREGILPTNRNNRDRLFRKYIVSLLEISSAYNITIKYLAETIRHHEKLQYGEITIGEEILEKTLYNIPLRNKN